MRENYTNFATTTLAAAITTTTALSFTVASGQGALFPAGNFIVTIDTEILQIFSRSGDTFTVGTGGRGYDSSTAATHANGATVQCSLTRYSLTHLWQNVADTYAPQVPPIQISGTPSAYDNEFEAAGSWVLSPSASGGTTFNIGSSVFSHLLFARGTTDNGTYTAYIAYALTGAMTLTCKISDATSFLHTNQGDQAQTHLFVSDQANPSSGPDTGTRFRMDTITTVNLSSSGLPTRWIRAAIDTTGTYSQIGPTVGFPVGVPLWLRITYDGAGNWVAYFGDGIAYYQLATKSSFLSAPQSLGLTYYSYIPSGQNMPHVSLVDYVRVQTSVLPPYAN